MVGAFSEPFAYILMAGCQGFSEHDRSSIVFDKCYLERLAGIPSKRAWNSTDMALCKAGSFFFRLSRFRLWHRNRMAAEAAVQRTDSQSLLGRRRSHVGIMGGGRLDVGGFIVVSGFEPGYEYLPNVFSGHFLAEGSQLSFDFGRHSGKRSPGDRIDDVFRTGLQVCE